MIVAATVVLAAQSAALVLVVRMLLQARETADSRQAEERRQLSDRIQAPDRIPVVPMPEFILPEQDDDEFNLVGAIVDSEDFE